MEPKILEELRKQTKELQQQTECLRILQVGIIGVMAFLFVIALCI